MLLLRLCWRSAQSRNWIGVVRLSRLAASANWGEGMTWSLEKGHKGAVVQLITSSTWVIRGYEAKDIVIAMPSGNDTCLASKSMYDGMLLRLLQCQFWRGKGMP